MDFLEYQKYLAILILWLFGTFIVFPAIFFDGNTEYLKTVFVSMFLQLSIALIAALVISVDWSLGVLFGI